MCGIIPQILTFPFSIHAPLWGATVYIIVILPMLIFQSTHPCGVRRILSNASWNILFISIHAPLWGATRIYVTDELGYIFDFNPRTLAGCDNKVTYSCRDTEYISIHAPLWGATTLSWEMNIWRCRFQSTHPCGVRQQKYIINNNYSALY
mgnify:CR=1 FL=1